MAGEIVFTVNSPGEVSTWLAPTVAALRQLDTGVHVSVHILPCLYASGTEAEVIRGMPGVDSVVTPGESWRYILRGRLPAGWKPRGRGAVVFLGGEMLLAARLARRLGYPAAAYTQGHVVSSRDFARFFVPREDARRRAIAKGAPAERVEVVGDLMVDAARVVQDPGERAALASPLGLEPGAPAVALFPGSRPYELRQVLPLFAAAAAVLAKEARVQFIVALSPFVTREALAAALHAAEAAAGSGAPAAAEGPGAVLERAVAALFAPETKAAAVPVTLRTAAGPASLTLWRGDPRAVMAAADLALTIPGSNTAELAAWGVPMVVCLPLHKPEEIPLDGIAGYLDRIPLIGRPLKRRAVLSASRRAQYIALPNRAAGEAIVPELRSERLAPEEIAAEAKRLLDDPERLEAAASRLVRAMGPPGAARRVAQGALELFQR